MTAVTTRSRFQDLVAAEWIKLWSLRSTQWVLLGGALVIIGLNIQGAVARYRLIEGWSTRDLAEYNWLVDGFGQAPAMLLMLAAGAVGALAITGEHSSGLIRTTFAAVPTRRAVIAAKAVVLTVAMTLVGTPVAVISLWVSQAILDRRGGGLSIGDPGVLAGVAGTALLPAMCALLGLGIGVLVRHAAAALVGVAIVLFLLPEATKGDSFEWMTDVHEALPLSAWHALRDAPWPHLLGGDDPWAAQMPSPAQAWLTFAAWPVAAVAAALVAVHHRDV